jgi:hypothetical protein
MDSASASVNIEIASIDDNSEKERERAEPIIIEHVMLNSHPLSLAYCASCRLIVEHLS